MKLFFAEIIKIIESVVISFVSLFIKRNKKKLAFGSWLGNSYSDNSRYLLEHMLKAITDEDYTFYWVGNEKIKPMLPDDKRVIFLKLNSLSSIPKLLKCYYFFSSQFPSGDICDVNVFQNAKVVYLDHGIYIKLMGTDARYNGIEKDRWFSFVKRITGSERKLDYMIASSPLNGEANASAYGYLGISLKNNLCIGHPRNDYLFLNKKNEMEIKRVKKMFAKMLNYDPGKKVIIYLPTFRWNIEDTPSLFFADESETKPLQGLLENNNAILIEKSHNRLIRRKIMTDKEVIQNRNMFLLSSMVDTQELLLASDMLISDYSGCLLDYLILDRPIIDYVPDYEHYRDVDTGLRYELEDYSSGDTPRDLRQLTESIRDFLLGTDNYSKKRERNRNRFVSYELGNSSETLTNICIGKDSFNKHCLLG